MSTRQYSKNNSFGKDDSSVGAPPDPSSLAQLNMLSPKHSNSIASQEDPVFPESDEIKSRNNLEKSTPNLKITEAHKFSKSKSKIRLPSKVKVPYFKSSSNIAMGSQWKMLSSKESKDFRESVENTNNRLHKSGLNLKLWESTDTMMDENAFIRKLQRSPKTKEDAKFIYNYIIRFPFFQKFHEENLQSSVDEAFLQICKLCDYEKHPQNSIIFKEGDRSNEKFYIIVSGKVHIYLQDRSVFMQENLETPSIENQPPSKSIVRRKSSLFTAPKLTQHPDQSSKKKGSVMTQNVGPLLQKNALEVESAKQRIIDLNSLPELGTKRNELGRGEAFGEKALFASDPENAKRTATIIAATDVEFMIIRKAEFDQIILRFSKQNHMKFDFLIRVLPFLNSIHSVSTLENLVYSFKEEIVGIDMTVTEEGSQDPLEKIYYIHEGFCRVEKTFQFLINGISHRSSCKICDLAEGSLIGEEIIFKEKVKLRKGEDPYTYNYSVIVLSENAKFYVISKADFLLKFPKEVRNFLFEQFLIKEKSRKEIFLKNSKEQLKRYQEEQLQTLIQTNFLKNKDLMKNMSVNMKRNYIEKVKGMAEELTKEEYNRDLGNQRKSQTSNANRQKSSWKRGNEEPYSIIESLKTQAKFKEMKKYLKLKQDAFLEILKKPEEIQDFIKSHEHKYLIRSCLSSGVRWQITTDQAEEHEEKPNRTSPRALDFGEKLDFGNGVEDGKLERMRRIKLGLFKPENPQFIHYNVIDHLSLESQKNKELLEKLRIGGEDLPGVHLMTCRGLQSASTSNLTSTTPVMRPRQFSSVDIRKGPMLGKFERLEERKPPEELGVGAKVEKKEKDFNFYRLLKEKGQNYQRLFGRKRKTEGQ